MKCAIYFKHEPLLKRLVIPNLQCLSFLNHFEIVMYKYK